jgi:hypothetical protein
VSGWRFLRRGASARSNSPRAVAAMNSESEGKGHRARRKTATATAVHLHLFGWQPSLSG